MEYVCRLGTQDGRIVEEVHEARDEGALKSELERKGYHIFDLRRRGLLGGLTLPRFGRGGKRISAEQFTIFNQELAALLKAGLPLLQTLDLMLERMDHPHFKVVLTDVRDRVKSGEDLSSAFEAHGELFPRLYPSTLKAGERSGELELMIRRFVRYMNLVSGARKKVVSALVYPAVLVGLALAMIMVMTVYVIPKFQDFFANMDAELPVLTRAVLSLSLFAERYWLWLLAGVVAAVLALRQWLATPSGELALDRLKLRLPLLGTVLHRFALSEFCRALGTLLAGGMPLVPAFEIASRAVGNAAVRSRLEPTIEKVREGQPFHRALEDSGIVTDMVVDMIKVGEATGSLDEMLNNVSGFLDEQVEIRMQRILSLLEPILLVIMGGMIASLLMSIYLPLFSLLGETRW